MPGKGCAKRCDGGVPEPFGVDDLRQTFEEGSALLLDLFRQSVVCDEVHILKPVVACNRDIASVRKQVDRLRFAELLLGDGEVERELFGVAGVVLELHESLVELWIERGQVVQVALFVEPLGQEEPGEGDVDQNALVEGLS